MQAELSPYELWERLHGKAEGPFFLLDIRNEDERRSWKIQGPVPVPAVELPYFAFIDDEEGTVASVPQGLGETVVVCARGGSSDYVAGVLQTAGRRALHLAGGMMAWGELQVPLRVPTEGPFELWQINRCGKGCLSYVVIAGGEAAIVDPSRFPEVYERLVAERGARIVEVLETHVHADHLSGGPELAKRTGATYRLVSGTGREPVDGVRFEPIEGKVSIQLGGDDGVTIEAHAFPIPGPSAGATLFVVGGRHLLSGNVLFARGIGRPWLGGQAEEWGRILRRMLREVVADLPDETEVLPGHCADPTEEDSHALVRGELGKLWTSVHELRRADPEELVAAMRAGTKDIPSVRIEIVMANLGLNEAGEMASEWELGKIVCPAVMG